MGFVCDLPYPPSLNGNWRQGRGRTFKSKKYADWLTKAGWCLKEQGPLPNYDGFLAISIEATRPDKRKRDLDNIIKPILDLLSTEGHAVMEDDSLVHSLSVRWREEGEGVSVHVWPLRGKVAA